MDQVVRVDAKHLQELASRLADRRVAVERELSVLGEPSKGMNDVFRHCRGFERAYSMMLQEADTSFKIRGVVEGLLPQTLKGIPIEKRFNRNYTREVCREADGYQPHLVSPEKGLRRLVQEAMKLTEAHVHRFVDDIHQVLSATVREAARRAVLTEHGVFGAPKGMEFMRLKGFENAVVIAAGKALEDWKAEAHSVADTMVRMECDYVTPSFFRELEREYQEARAARLKAEQEGEEGEEEDEDEEGGGGGGGGGDEGVGDDEADDGGAGAAKTAADGEDARPTPGATKVGWLEKHAGDSRALGHFPIDSWKWLRRFFVLKGGAAATLSYYKNPEEFHTGNAARVVVKLRDCVVEDWEGRGRKGETGTNLIRIINKDPSLPVAKNNHELMLRALDAQDKTEWLQALRSASGSIAPAPKKKKPAAAAKGGDKDGQDGAPGGEPPRPGTVRVVMPNQAPVQQPRGLFGRSVAATRDAGAAAKRGLGFGRGGEDAAAEATVGGKTIEVPTVEDIDTYYDKLGTFTGLYARTVFDRMARTVPKAIILCQVIRSRDRLLDQLYTYLSSLKPKEIDELLAEDPSVIKRRSAARQAVKELIASLDEVRQAQEERAGLDVKTRDPTAYITVRSLILAGAYPLVPSNAVPPKFDVLRVYGAFTPVSLLAGYETGPPPKLGPEVKQLPAGKPSPALPAPAGDAQQGKQDAADGAPKETSPAPRGRPSDGQSPAPPGPASPAAQASLEAMRPRRQAPPPPPR